MNKRIMTFILNNWFFILFLVGLLFLFIQSQVEISLYKKKVNYYNSKIDSLQKRIDLDFHIIDSLTKADTIFVKEIQIIKEKANENIKYVDTMSVSDMQDFFSNRYKHSQN